jgi:hypothetical protein
MFLLERFADFLIRMRGVLLFACAVLVGLAIGPSSRLDFDRTIESMFRADDARHENYREDKELLAVFVLNFFLTPEPAGEVAPGHKGDA